MKYFFRSIVFCLILSFLFIGTHTCAYASAVSTASDSDADHEQTPFSIITEIRHKTYDIHHLPTVELVQNDAGYRDPIFEFVLSFNNSRFVKDNFIAVLQNPDGTTSTLPLDVMWNCLDPALPQVDPLILGTQTELGVILTPSNASCKFADDVPRILELPVHIVEPDEPYQITNFDPYYKNFKQAIAILPGGDLEKPLKSLSERVMFYEADGTFHIGTISWDTDSVDINTVGVYEIEGTFMLPMHCVFAENADIPELKLTVVVQEPDKPDIHSYSRDIGGISFPWILTPEMAETVQPWISENDGPWEKLSNVFGNTWTQKQLLININTLNKGSSYRLQVKYQNGQSGILHFTYTDDLYIEKYVGGDRDGGDTDGNPPLIGSGKPIVGGGDNSGSGSGGNSSSSDSSGSGGNSSSGDSSGSGGNSSSGNSSGSGGGSGSSDSSNGGSNSEDQNTPGTIPPAASPDDNNTPVTDPAEPPVPESKPALGQGTDRIPEEPDPYEEKPILFPKETLPAESTAAEPIVTEPADNSAFECEERSISETKNKDTESQETSSSSAVSDERAIENYLPTITIIAVLAAISSFLFLILSKRRNKNDVESP